MSHSQPYTSSDLSKKEQVTQMFNLIAQNYDLANKVLSARIDRLWRKKAVRLLQPYKPQCILDLATGTGDFAIALLHLQPKKIVGIDVATNMIDVGKKKIQKLQKQHIIDLHIGDAEHLDFPDMTFDAVVSAFGFRNFEDRQRNLQESHRVLNKGGVCLVLEFSQPTWWLNKWFYHLYLYTVIPYLGGMISNHKKAYEYLNKSIHTFPSDQCIIQLMQEAGFKGVRSIALSGGICRIWICEK